MTFDGTGTRNWSRSNAVAAKITYKINWCANFKRYTLYTIPRSNAFSGYLKASLYQVLRLAQFKVTQNMHRYLALLHFIVHVQITTIHQAQNLFFKPI